VAEEGGEGALYVRRIVSEAVWSQKIDGGAPPPHPSPTGGEGGAWGWSVRWKPKGGHRDRRQAESPWQGDAQLQYMVADDLSGRVLGRGQAERELCRHPLRGAAEVEEAGEQLGRLGHRLAQHQRLDRQKSGCREGRSGAKGDRGG
jgi:hypothetical protein